MSPMLVLTPIPSPSPSPPPQPAAAAPVVQQQLPPRPPATFARTALADLKWSDIPNLLAEYQGLAALVDELYSTSNSGSSSSN